MITEELVKSYFKIHGTIKINNDVVDVEGEVSSIMPMTELPFQFGKVTGEFICPQNNLTSLKGSPCSVHNFYLSDNKLESLEGGPTEVNGFFCEDNRLSSLIGSPTKVTSDFNCSNNELASLIGAPKTVGGNFVCFNCNLSSLIGAPEEVGGNFECTGNHDLTSFEGAPKIIEDGFYCDWTENLPMLSLLKYKAICIFDNNDVNLILRKYAGKKPLRQSIIQCQRELIDAGFEGNARL